MVTGNESDGATHRAPVLPAGAVCAAHEGTYAMFVCARCGTFACNACYAFHTEAGPTCYACSQVVAAELVPWEAPEKYGWIRAFWLTTKRASFTPTMFFRAVALGRRWQAPLLYSVLIFTLCIPIQTAIQEAMRALAPTRAPSAFLETIGFDEGTIAWVTAIVSIVLSPLTILVTAGLPHLVLRLLREARAPYTSTLRAICYAQGPFLWMAPVPFVGPYVGAVWLVVVQVVAIREVHRTSTGKAVLAAVMPGLFFGLVIGLCVLTAMLVAMVAAFRMVL